MHQLYAFFITHLIMKILCVAEKNSIAKAVAGILGGGRFSTRNTTVNYVKNYDFTFDFGGLLGSCQVTMTAVAGHLTSADFPPQFNWGKCQPIELFEAPVTWKHPTSILKKIADNIGKESRGSSKLMIWTDCDREGEHIGYEIMKAAVKGMPMITVDSVLRANFSHLERSHIIHAAKNPGQLKQEVIDAVEARLELDIRAGFAFTRLLSELLKPRVNATADRDVKVISYGTCQFPTLGFVVDRYKRVRSFKSEKFWYLQITTVKNRIKTDFLWTRPNMFDRLSAVALYSNCMASDKKDVAKVTSKIEKPTTNYKPLPLTTVALQKQAARLFKMSAKDTLNAAESLYHKGFLSYPRTETDSFPKKMDLKQFVSNQTQHAQWGNYAAELLAGKFNQPRSGRNNDEAHTPIHPTTFTDGSLFNVKEKKIYEYVVRHFLACCSEDAKGSTTVCTVQWGDEVFTATALEVKYRGYLDIYTYSSWNTSKSLPSFTVGEEVKLASALVKEGKTSPPSFMTEPELIALMDANGIGTDATIADHIDTIKNREYITLHKQAKSTLLLPTELGMALVQGFENIQLKDNISLTKPFLRRSMEADFVRICEKTKSKAEVAHKFNQMYMEAYSLTSQKRLVLLTSYDEVVAENANNV